MKSTSHSVLRSAAKLTFLIGAVLVCLAGSLRAAGLGDDFSDTKVDPAKWGRTKNSATVS